MDNVFITQYFDWSRPASRKVRWVNALLSMLRIKSRFVPPMATGEQTSIEQRINLYHLAEQVLVRGVPGEFVEIGAHQGSTALLLQVVLSQRDHSRRLHVYDTFFSSSPDELAANFKELGQTPPMIHNGLFRDTLPKLLPEQVAFAHLDVGWGQPFPEHRDILTRCLDALYPRLAAEGICVVADYCDPEVFSRNGFTPPATVMASDRWNVYPAVKAACDSFFADKPESIAVLYGGPYSHGFFRKQKTETLL